MSRTTLPPTTFADLINRRTFLGRSSVALGSAALTSLIQQDGLGAAPLPPNTQHLTPLPHFPARIKRVIFLYMSGGPSHLETFDYKPKLGELNDQPMPE